MRELERQVRSRDGDPLRHVGPQPEVHPLLTRVPERHVGEGLDVEVGPELTVEHVQAVVTNAAVTPRLSS